MYTIRAKISVIVMFLLVYSAASAQSTDTLLIRLNKILAQKQDFVDVKQQRIQALTRELNNNRYDQVVAFTLLKKLALEYKTFIYDSAFNTAQRLQRVAYSTRVPENIVYARMQIGFVLLSAGMFKETLDTLASITARGLPDSLKIDYYFAMGRTYYDLGDFDKDKFYTPYYTRLGSTYLDSARTLCKQNSYLFYYLNGLKHLKSGNDERAVADLTYLLDQFPLSQHERAVTASTLSYYYNSHNDLDKAIELLAIAAIADIETATRETMALQALAELLYKQGDVKNAYTYIVEAMADAEFYGAKLRKVQVGSVMPLITASKVSNIEDQRLIAIMYASAITFLAILVVVFAVLTLRQLKKRKIAEKQLVEANKIKEEYIAYYFSIHSEYVNKIGELKIAIESKLTAKRVDDIRYLLTNINLKEERDELYHSFDKIFVKIFPNFVTEFNNFFKLEDRIVLKEGQVLNTELRIFALIRLGIQDNETIARILDYSINTIYSYKNRVKSKSIISNDQFEKEVMKIESY